MININHDNEDKHQTLNEPRHEKTCLPGLRPGKIQNGLQSHRN